MKNLVLPLMAILFCQIVFAQEIIIKDPTIIPIHTDHLIQGKSILIKNGRIAKMASFASLKKNKSTIIIDAKGKFIMPGLADMHIHLPTNKHLDSTIKESLSAGVTHIRVMNSEEDPLGYLTKNQQKYASDFPRIYLSYIITRKDRYTLMQLDSLVTSVKKQGYHFIKLFSVADEATFLNLMKVADMHQIIVAGHFPSNVSMELVLKSSFRSIEHLGGYTQEANFKNLHGLVELSKQVFNCPTLNYFKEAKVDIVYQSKLERVFQKLAEQDCLLLVGSDLGGSEGMLKEMKIWENLGISRYKILKAATMNPALFFKESNQWGSIQVGKEASLLLLDKNPLTDIDHLKSIQKIFLRGKLVKN